MAQDSLQWAGGRTFVKVILRSLAAASRDAAAEVWLISHDESPALVAGVRHARIEPPSLLPGERLLRAWLRRGQGKQSPLPGEARIRWFLGAPDGSDAFGVARHRGIDALLPMLDVPPFRVTAGVVAWIPDFQHLHLPELFTGTERAHRDNTIRRVAERASRILLSSESARRDFLAIAPEAADRARVVPFPSRLAFEDLPGAPEQVSRRFDLPAKFALVANQFWSHKNHALVVEAVARLARSGLSVPVAMTGLPIDPRDPTNAPVTRVLQAIAREGLRGQVVLLGQVSEDDLVALMRTATVVIQPSRFEGWSTVVQDAKAVGRPLICSDLPVHREQAPEALGFFATARADALADLLRRHWPVLKPGPDSRAEAGALGGERAFARRHGQALLQLCREAAGRAGSEPTIA